ncbi:unnamed protein product [Calypogeia fissa]
MKPPKHDDLFEEEERICKHYCETLEGPSNIDDIMARSSKRFIKRCQESNGQLGKRVFIPPALDEVEVNLVLVKEHPMEVLVEEDQHEEDLGTQGVETKKKEIKAQPKLGELNLGNWHGGLRLAQLEKSLDPTLRNHMEVVKKEHFKKVLVANGKEFYIGHAFGPGQENTIQELLMEYQDVFAWRHSDITGIDERLGEFRIDLIPGATPVRQRQYRINSKYSMMVKEEIDKLLEAGFIYPVATNDWVSPVVIVPKKVGMDGQQKIRVCQNFRKLNEATKKDYFPIPFTDMVLDIVVGWEVYSFLDGYSGYNQIWIRKEDQLKTVFTIEWGVFAFRRMPFGLCNAPGSFQRIIMAIFHDFLRKFVEVFIDDFVVYGTKKEHVDYLRLTFQRCREIGLKLHPGKCIFGVEEGTLLGHKVSKKGIEVDQSKVQIWQGVKFPTNTTEVRGFLGCLNYYKRFIKDFAKLTIPITSMLKKEADFEPTKERCFRFLHWCGPKPNG